MILGRVFFFFQHNGPRVVIDSVFLPPYKLGAVFAGVVTKAQNCFFCLLESRLVCEGVLEGGVSLQKVTPSDHLYFGSLLSLWVFTYVYSRYVSYVFHRVISRVQHDEF